MLDASSSAHCAPLFLVCSAMNSGRGVTPSPGRVGATTRPSVTAIGSSGRSCRNGLAPSEYSITVAAGLANARLMPALNESAEPQQCGASSNWYASASAAIRRPSVGPPQIARSGCSTSTASSLDQVAEVEPGELALAGRDRDVGRRSNRRCATTIVGVDGLFEPPQAEWFDAGREPLGLGRAERAVGVDHQADTRPERGAGRRDPGDARLDVAVHHPDAHLDRGEATFDISVQLGSDPSGVRPAAAGVQRHVGSARPAPQFDDRRAERLAEQIPQRHVDAAHRRDVEPASAEHRKRASPAERVVPARAVVHLLPELRDPTSVLADELRAELVGDQRHERRAAAGAADRRLRLAPADEPTLDLDPHEGHVEAGDATEVGHVLPLGRDRDRQPAGVDAADDHRQRSH